MLKEIGLENKAGVWRKHIDKIAELCCIHSLDEGNNCSCGLANLRPVTFFLVDLQGATDLNLHHEP
ncbi:unnamed protein product [Prunus armeniaca]|uniref:Uncharacterized protein n=1 Tax=Prunus armeniaca TaxID=36596 RepID=A0A6J5TVN3_PRUAR|nr:unnamed protein product [Prunus armeniaca]